MERVILAPGSDDDDEDEDDLYKGYNEFHPTLDTRVSTRKLHTRVGI